MNLRRNSLPGSPSLLPIDVLDDLNETKQSAARLNDNKLESIDECDSPCAALVSPKHQHCRRLAVQSMSWQDNDSSKETASSCETQMKRAGCARASRAARACDPSSGATIKAYNIMYAKFREIKEADISKAPKNSNAFSSFRMSFLNMQGRGAALKTIAEYQAKMNHLASLKSKNVDSQNTEPAFLLGGFTTPMLWDRLAENSLKSNAVNSSVMNRKKTQGAANQVNAGTSPPNVIRHNSEHASDVCCVVPQTTRISCRSIGQAASSQICSVALTMARSRFLLRAKGISVVSPIATNAVDVSTLSMSDLSGVESDELFCVTSTSNLIYNACPVKLSSVSVLSACINLARRELDEFYISNAMCVCTDKLQDICKSLVGRLGFDPVWCSWVLIGYLCSNPRGRDILKQTGLTDIDIQSASVFERYGSEEIKRRVRQRKLSPAACTYDAPEYDDIGDHMWKRDGKRKRTTNGTSSSSGSDAYALLEFWHSALQSQDVNVLNTLASHTKRTARDAALFTLLKQSEGSHIGHNTLLQNVSLQNATKSAKALVSFVGRRADEIPALVAFRAENPKTNEVVISCGMLRTDDEVSTSTIHTCTLVPKHLRPPPCCKVQIAWSCGSTKLSPTNKDTCTIPGVLERCRKIFHVLRNEKLSKAKRSRRVSALQSFVDSETEKPLTQPITGTTRSFISIQTFMAIDASHQNAAVELAKEGLCLLEDAKKIQHDSDSVPMLLSKSQKNEFRNEPIASPTHPISLAISANETLRRWLACKTRKNDVCKVSLGFSSPSEVIRDMPGIMSSEPLPLLTMTDFGVECIDEIIKDGDTDRVKVSMKVDVCGDGAIRLTDALKNLNRHLHDEVVYMKQCRAAVFVAASQASFIGVVSSTLACGYTNASIASSKKIVTPDVNTLMLLTPFDTYVAGLCNVVRSFDPGPYSGTYGSRVDTGYTPHGLLSHNYRSDKRQHGNCCLSERAADELAIAFGENHWKVFDDPLEDDSVTSKRKLYTAVPTAVRGIPHGYIPGVHSLLNGYCNFLETCRTMAGREEADTVDSIMVLPLSPFSQSLPCDLEPSVDSSLRTCFRDSQQSSVCTGRAYSPSSTREEDAIVREPLFRRPCQVSSGDCPFATAYENVESFFNCASSLALLGRCFNDWYGDSEDALDRMHRTISMFVNGDDKLTNVLSCWAIDFLVLINILYPSNLSVGEFALLRAFEQAAPQCHQADGKGSALCLENIRGLDAVDVRYAKLFWSAFCRPNKSTCAWKYGLCPFLKLLMENDGSHLTGPETISRFRTSLENAVRSVWLVYSDDGIRPPPTCYPTSSATSVDKVGRHHIDPIFVGSGESGVKQRASPIGLKPHSFRQVLSQLLGAELSGVRVNVALNEGGMSLRVSSDPTILDSKGLPRTEKSISPVQTEGDERAYGNRADKIQGAVAQKRAWDMNALICKPLFVAVEPPQHPEVRSRGEYGLATFFKEEAEKRRSTEAIDMLRQASKSSLYRTTNL